MLRFISIRLLELGKIKWILKVFRITLYVRYSYNKITYVSELFYGRLFSRDSVYEIHGEDEKCRYSRECNCSYYGLVFVAWKYNGMNKSWLLLQNRLRQTCNISVFTFIKHLLKQRDVLQIQCFVEKKINHIVLTWTIRFHVKQVKLKPHKFCITWKVVVFSEFFTVPH